MAARNVLLTHDLKAKVADFGLATRIYQDVNLRKRNPTTLVPLSWTAYEVLSGNTAILEKSDVWSFGVVMWEIFQLCSAQPFGQNRTTARDLVEMLEDGQRLGRPFLCPESIYEIMQQCWNLEPARRPSFQDLKIQLDTLITVSETPANDRQMNFQNQRFISAPNQGTQGHHYLPFSFVTQNPQYGFEVNSNGYVPMSCLQNGYVPMPSRQE